MAKKKVEDIQDEPIEAPVEDRSDYNCPICGGEGLVAIPHDYIKGDLDRCPKCGGTGKI